MGEKNMDPNKNWQKDITLFLTSQTISLFGSMLVQYAITWYITLTTQSATMMTISIVCGFLPTFFLSPFAGVWADRYDRKLLIMLSDSAIAITTLILAILFFMGYDAVWLLFVISAIRALGTGIQTPAVGAFLPQLAPEEHLTKVNATNGSIQSLVTLVSPVLSGALLTITSIEVIFLIDVITAAIAVSILLLFLHIPAHPKALNKQIISYFGDMRQGIVYIKNHRFVKTIFSVIAIYFILIAPVAFLTPLLITRSFGEDVWRLTASSVMYSAGMMVGGVIVATWKGFKNKAHSMALSIFVIGACTFAFGVIPVFWIYLFLMGLIGVAMPFFNTPFIVLLQEKVEGDFMGRVFGVLSMISSSIMPLGMLMYGPLADFIKIEWLLIGTGLLLLIQGLFMLGNNALIEAGKPTQS
jgi:DHA3 family macrolide efflux protein-like MFS transporter